MIQEPLISDQQLAQAFVQARGRAPTGRELRSARDQWERMMFEASNQAQRAARDRLMIRRSFARQWWNARKAEISQRIRAELAERAESHVG